jgi:hypothetical protein
MGSVYAGQNVGASLLAKMPLKSPQNPNPEPFLNIPHIP